MSAETGSFYAGAPAPRRGALAAGQGARRRGLRQRGGRRTGHNLALKRNQLSVHNGNMTHAFWQYQGSTSRCSRP
jgi:hypothetical protein